MIQKYTLIAKNDILLETFLVIYLGFDFGSNPVE